VPHIFAIVPHILNAVPHILNAVPHIFYTVPHILNHCRSLLRHCVIFFWLCVIIERLSDCWVLFCVPVPNAFGMPDLVRCLLETSLILSKLCYSLSIISFTLFSKTFWSGKYS
jgi:hypothetical protein